MINLHAPPVLLATICQEVPRLNVLKNALNVLPPITVTDVQLAMKNRGTLTNVESKTIPHKAALNINQIIISASLPLTGIFLSIIMLNPVPIPTRLVWSVKIQGVTA